MTAATPPGSRAPLELPLYGASWAEAMRRFFLKYATFRGRASRSEFWWWVLTAFVTDADTRESLGVFDAVAVTDPYSGVLAVLQLAVFVPSLAVSWRRMHDIDRTGLWTLFFVIPLAGPIVYVIMTAWRPRPSGVRYD
jgi:uncharacterized membrane protein YhaH (DUF805 family)